MFYFLQNMRWNFNTNYLKEKKLGMTRFIYKSNGLQRYCSESNSKGSIPATKYHRMTEQAESLTTVFMQIPSWSMTPIISRTSNLKDESTISSRMVRTNSSVTRCHIPEEQNPQLHYCENLKYSPTAIHLHHFTIKCTPLPKFNSVLWLFLHNLSTIQENCKTRQDGEYI